MEMNVHITGANPELNPESYLCTCICVDQEVNVSGGLVGLYLYIWSLLSSIWMAIGVP